MLKKKLENLKKEKFPNFSFAFMVLLKDPMVKNSHILSGVYFNVLKNVLDETLNSFDTEFGPH